MIMNERGEKVAAYFKVAGDTEISREQPCIQKCLSRGGNSNIGPLSTGPKTVKVVN
jgi:hypothetical protein